MLLEIKNNFINVYGCYREMKLFLITEIMLFNEELLIFFMINFN
jgi:hypothetical protein